MYCQSMRSNDQHDAGAPGTMADSINREEAPHVGEPADASLQDVAGIAPPCDECGSAEAVGEYDGRDLCGGCKPDGDGR